MASLEENIRKSSCHELHCTVQSSAGRFLCFTRLSGGTFFICASDGSDVWSMEFDSEELKTRCELAATSLDNYLGRIRSAFQNGEVVVTQTGIRVNMSLGAGPTIVDLDLYEAKAADKRALMQHILFRLADETTDLKNKLEQAKKKVDNFTRQNPAATSGMLDLGDSPKKATAPKVPKQEGMSIVNPGARKRRAPRGVQFD